MKKLDINEHSNVITINFITQEVSIISYCLTGNCFTTYTVTGFKKILDMISDCRKYEDSFTGNDVFENFIERFKSNTIQYAFGLGTNEWTDCRWKFMSLNMNTRIELNGILFLSNFSCEPIRKLRAEKEYSYKLLTIVEASMQEYLKRMEESKNEQ